MGRRSATETVVAIFQAFLESRTWRQCDLAGRVDLSVRQVRSRLQELSRHGLPLEREEEHPHVYWSLPHGWSPGGVVLDQHLLANIVELLLRLAPTPLRETLLAQVLSRAGWKTADLEWVVHTGSRGDENDRLWSLAHHAAREGRALRLDYRSASSPRGMRVVSPQRVWKGRATHLIAYCHKAMELRRFHFARVLAVSDEPNVAYVKVPAQDLQAFLRESVDGFHSGGKPVEVRFFVPIHDAQWVADALPDGLHGTTTDSGLEVRGRVSSPQRAAAFVASLGGIARNLSPELGREVRRIAQRLLRGL